MQVKASELDENNKTFNPATFLYLPISTSKYCFWSVLLVVNVLLQCELVHLVML